jgi:hypothetical protein
MPYSDLLKGAGKTTAAPTTRQANPVRTPRKTAGKMSLDEFMKRNPSARDLDKEKADKVKAAQERKGQRSNKGRSGRPNVRETMRSRRGTEQQAQQEAPVDAPTKALAQNKILAAAVLKLNPGQ